MPTTVNEVTTSIWIDAPVETVWNAVTSPALIKKWFFGVDTDAEWRVGGRLVHRGTYQGKPYVDSGEILELAPPRHLVHTHWSDVSGRPDLPENREIVSWDLVDDDGGTSLTIGEQNLASADAASTSEEAWQAALQSLKSLLEGSET